VTAKATYRIFVQLTTLFSSPRLLQLMEHVAKQDCQTFEEFMKEQEKKYEDPEQLDAMLKFASQEKSVGYANLEIAAVKAFDILKNAVRLITF